MASQKKKENEFSYKSYQESDAVTEARKKQEEVLANKPADYKSAISGDIKNSMNQYLNREKFSYDMNADPTYNQYKNAFVQQGKMAMMDTMGQAAALTGGYGSSYASVAGNQAYQQNLQQLNSIVPELEQNAYSRYQQEGQDMLNRYALLSEQENLEYSRYRDSMADWHTERSLAESKYNAERDYDYNKYQSDKAFDYGAYRDAVADSQWETEKKSFENSVATGGEEAGLQHVSSMSPEEIISAMQGYQADEDNEGLRNFLFYCVNAGMMTPEMMDSYYRSYRTPELGEEEEEESFAPMTGFNGPGAWNDLEKWRK